MTNDQNNTEAMNYIKSLKDSVKRRYAVTYLQWILDGRSGSMPARGTLSPTLARAVGINLDALS